MKSIRNQAIQDMASVGVQTFYILQEKAILEFISEESFRVDFRKFNGGHYDKHALLAELEEDIQLLL